MYCPKCAAQNIDDAQFCRACGANISLVSQALSGKLPTSGLIPPLAPMFEMKGFDSLNRRKDNLPPSQERGIKHFFMGVGFLFVAICLALFSGQHGQNAWWYWMLIPAFSLMGGGVAEMVRVKQSHRAASLSETATPQAFSTTPPPPQMNQVPVRNTAEMAPPPSVTEGTTRHLGSEAATQHFDADVKTSNENR